MRRARHLPAQCVETAEFLWKTSPASAGSGSVLIVCDWSRCGRRRRAARSKMEMATSRRRGTGSWTSQDASVVSLSVHGGIQKRPRLAACAAGDYSQFPPACAYSIWHWLYFSRMYVCGHASLSPSWHVCFLRSSLTAEERTVG